MRRQAGFTLAELAIVMLIFFIMLGGMIMSITTQMDLRNISDTQKTMDLAREALVGYAVANGRLPCPAIATSLVTQRYLRDVANTATGNGVEALTGVNCTATDGNTTDGYVPAVTLGLTPTDAQGFLVDAWGTRIRYAVTTDTRFTTTTAANQMKQVGISALAPDLVVCSTARILPATLITAVACPSGATTTLTSTAVAVIWSLGKNARTTGGVSTDEARNVIAGHGNGTVRTFVYHDMTDASADNGEFDDLVTWLSPNILYNRMIAAGAI